MAFSTYAEAATAFRRYLNDTPQLNTLDREIESTDDELVEFIKDALNEMNNRYEPQTRWKLENICVEPGVDNGTLPWSTVKLGAILQLLTIKGIISARNTLTYSDQGGVTIQAMDKYGRYQSFFNQLSQVFETKLMQLKIRENIATGFGGVNSPMGFDYYYGN